MAKKRTAQPVIASPGATPNQLRAWAYLGAWELVVDIVAEFPGILPQLNAAIANGGGALPLYRIGAAENMSVRDMVRNAPTNGATPHKPKREYKYRQTPAQITAGRRKMTPEQRAELSERMRKQWRKVKREGRSALGAKSGPKPKSKTRKPSAAAIAAATA